MQTIISTRSDLEIANEKIAIQKAKELNTESYEFRLFSRFSKN
jgi:hypothetical protein